MSTLNDPSKGRRAPLNRDRVLDAGVALADAEGIRALTMRRLGRELGVEGMALYNHVASKDDLLDGMIDRVVGEIELPDDESANGSGDGSGGGSDWRESARRRAVSAHAALLRHPWAAALWTSSINLGPARMRYMDSALRSLREAGFPPDLLDRTFHTIDNHIVGHALQALGFPLAHDQMEEVGERFLRSFPVEEYPDLAAHVRHHLEHQKHQKHQDHQEQGDSFEFGLDLILDGLERKRGQAFSG